MKAAKAPPASFGIGAAKLRGLGVKAGVAPPPLHGLLPSCGVRGEGLSGTPSLFSILERLSWVFAVPTAAHHFRRDNFMKVLPAPAGASGLPSSCQSLAPRQALGRGVLRDRPLGSKGLGNGLGYGGVCRAPEAAE